MADSDITADGRLIDELTTIVSRASAAILKIRAEGLSPRTKADRSPVTLADEASEAVILDGVARLLPGLPIVSEEAVARGAAPVPGNSFVLVDPLDGTREIIAGRNEFTVNLGIVINGKPALGIVAAPALGLIWRTCAGGAERLRLAPGSSASSARERTTIRPRPWPHTGFAAAVSRSHLDAETEAFLARLPKVERRASGSAIKFCQVAEGMADLYPRLATTCEWDVAAGHAVLAATGGIVTTPQGMPLTYGRQAEGFRIAGFIAWGDPSAPARLGF